MTASAYAFVRGFTHAAFPMEDTTRVGEARRHAAWTASAAGLDATAAGRLAIVVTELGANLVRHARGGQLLIGAGAGSGEVEVISIDRGPGIADVGRSMADGFSTGGTPGTGLGAVRRLAQDFDLHTRVPEGTVMVARVRNDAAPRAARGLPCAGISLCAPGETECGDAWAAWVEGDRATVMVADGLGHGPEAAEASRAAIDLFEQRRDDVERGALGDLVERSHDALRGTRGAALAVVRADAGAGTLRYCGAGNVLGRAVSGTSDRSLVTQHGTVGVQLRRPEEAAVAWPEHALVAMHSDGIESRWNPMLIAPVLRQDPALAAALLLRDHCRGRDDATVVVVRRKD